MENTHQQKCRHCNTETETKQRDHTISWKSILVRHPSDRGGGVVVYQFLAPFRDICDALLSATTLPVRMSAAYLTTVHTVGQLNTYQK